VDLQTLGFAMAAGSLAAVNPCGFAMLPAYLTLVVVGGASISTGPHDVTVLCSGV
jgi:cytochrome c-type biogenesis protein